MISYGICITQANDPLQKTSVQSIASKIMHPPIELEEKINYLRQLKTIDNKQYQRLKVELPYFCCGLFHPPFRRKEYFYSISSFVVDLDHLSDAGIERSNLFDTLKQDPHVQLIFTSPGGDGLKVLFPLQEACTDAGLFSYFYKSYVRKFASKYHLENVVDWKVHDVTRAHFLSIDHGAWFASHALGIDIQQYVSVDDLEKMNDDAKYFDEKAKEIQASDDSDSIMLTDDTLTWIRQRLNPNYKPRRQNDLPYQPPELLKVMPYIIERLAQEGIQVIGTKDIQYGKQIRVMARDYWAELNIFYGKKGFSIVKTTKTGSNKELAELVFQLLDSYLADMIPLFDLGEGK